MSREPLTRSLRDVLTELVYAHDAIGGPIYVGQVRYRYPESLRDVSQTAIRDRLRRLREMGLADRHGRPARWRPTEDGREAIGAA